MIKKQSKNKKVRNATVNEYQGIKFRSKLERFTYIKLKEANINNFDYEKHKFVLNDKFEYTNECYEDGKLVTNKIRALTYTPDFVSLSPNKKGWIIEIKGFSNDTFPIKWKLFKHYLKENNYNVTLFKPKNQKNVLECINIIKQKYYA